MWQWKNGCCQCDPKHWYFLCWAKWEAPFPSSQDLKLKARGLISIFVTVTMLEEVKEKEKKRWRGGRQHVNEPAQCHWAPHRTAIWRIKDSYHLAASPTLYPHRIRIIQTVHCCNTSWSYGGKFINKWIYILIYRQLIFVLFNTQPSLFKSWTWDLKTWAHPTNKLT